MTDRGSVFEGSFAAQLCKFLNIDQRFSTAYHPQTDGQTERINAILEQYLRGYVNYQQDNWFDYLPLAEFMYNNTISSGIGNITPFFANYGFHPRFDFEINASTSPPRRQDVLNIQHSLSRLEEYLRNEMKLAQATYAEYADRKRAPPPLYKEGDYVWLMRKNIKTKRPSSKLDYKKIGKYKIIQRVGTHAYKLELPPSMNRLHPVFHTSLLEPAANNPLEGQVQPPPPPVVLDDGSEEFEVQEILDSRKVRNQIRYLVRWKGYSEPTWEPTRVLKNCQDAIDDFHRQYPSKPKP